MRNTARTLCFLLVLFFTVCGFSFSANAAGFLTEPVDDETDATVRGNCLFSRIEEQPQSDSIDCFDVNEKGWVLLASSNMGEATVSIYDDSFVFQYGYSFEQNSDYGMMWKGDNILYFGVRSDIQIEIDPNGEIVEVRSILRTDENEDYWDEVVFATKREVAGVSYEISNGSGIHKVFRSSYSMLHKTNADGQVVCLYDVDQEHHATTIGYILAILIFLGICALIAVQTTRKASKTGNGSLS